MADFVGDAPAKQAVVTILAGDGHGAAAHQPGGGAPAHAHMAHNMDKLGKAEITNNIYSLAVQAYDGGAMTLPARPSRFRTRRRTG